MSVKVILAAVAAILCVGLLANWGSQGLLVTGNGEATDQIARVQKNALWPCNGYEVYLLHDNPAKGVDASYGAWDKSVVENLTVAQAKGDRVTIKFHHYLATVCWDEVIYDVYWPQGIQ